jgi:hypothetical protein
MEKIIVLFSFLGDFGAIQSSTRKKRNVVVKNEAVFDFLVSLLQKNTELCL